jgi:hypothetical protein
MLNSSKTQWLNIQQNNDEWLGLRAGKITGSMFGTVMANYGKAFGEPAKKYAEKLAVERATGKPIETFKNEYMDRGHELEPVARELYELETFEDVTDGGMFVNGNIGVSPDGFASDGLIEIKSVIFNIQFERIKKGGMDLKYKWQVQGALWVSGLPWCDFVSFCPEMPESKRLYIYRVFPEVEAFKMLDERISEFEKLVQKNFKLL